MLPHGAADDTGTCACRGRLHRGKGGGGLWFGNEQDQSALTGTVEGVEAEDFADAAYFGADLQAGGVDLPQAAPLETGPAFVDIGKGGQGHRVAIFGHDAGVLVFLRGPALVKLGPGHFRPKLP